MGLIRKDSIKADYDEQERERKKVAFFKQLAKNDTEQQSNIDTAFLCVMELADEVYAEPTREDVAMLKGCVMELVEMIAPLFEE